MAAASKVSLKLLIDTKANKVLFAEAGKDCIDFLFYLLSLPVGTVVRLLKQNGMMGCLVTLYESIENMSETYFQPNLNKDSLLKPISSLSAAGIPLLLSDSDHQKARSTTRQYYTCDNSHYNLADVPNFSCPDCVSYYRCGYGYSNTMTREMTLISPPAEKAKVVVDEGFVKDVVTYMVMDNLEVKPMSTISSITLLNKFNVKDVGALEERVVVLGVNQGLKLLKASFESETVLTDVFLAKTAGTSKN